MCIQFSPDKISSKCRIEHHIRMKLLLIYYNVSAWKECFLLSNRDFFAAVPLLNPLDDPKCERTKMSVPRTPGRWLAISSVMWLPKWTFVQQIQRYMRHEYSQIGRIDYVINAYLFIASSSKYLVLGIAFRCCCRRLLFWKFQVFFESYFVMCNFVSIHIILHCIIQFIPGLFSFRYNQILPLTWIRHILSLFFVSQYPLEFFFWPFWKILLKELIAFELS